MPAETHVEQGELDRRQVFELIRDRLADILEIDPAGISEGSSFGDDLDADSLALIELVEALEEELAERTVGFRIDDVAYCTDVNEIPRESWRLLEGVRVLVLDALRHKPHPGHFCLDQALDVIDQFRPRQAYLTHMSHDIEHEEVSRRLPSGVELSYDGLTFEF